VPSDLFSSLGISVTINAFVIFFSLLFALGLAWLAYRFYRTTDENVAFWTAVGVFAVGFVVGILTLSYGALILLAVGAIVHFTPQIHRRSRTAALVIIGAVWLCYIGIPYTDNLKNPITKSAVANHFAYDDKDLLTGNDFLVGWMAGADDLEGHPVNYWKQVVSKDFARLAVKAAGAPSLNPINYYRPVIALSYMLDTYFWSEVPDWDTFRQKKSRSELRWKTLNPVGFHLTNVLVHALNSLLVFLLVRSLSRRYWVALAAGVLFAIHPIHTESVTWIAGRTDAIAMTFYLSAFWFYVRFRNTGSLGALATGIILAVVGVLTKEMVFPLGLVLVAYELIRGVARHAGAGDLHLPGKTGWLRDWRPGERLLLHCAIAFVFFSLIGMGVYFLVKSQLVDPSSVTGRPIPKQASPWFDRKANDYFAVTTVFFSFLKAGFWYLSKVLYPLPLNIYPNVPWVESAVVGFVLLMAHLVIVAIPIGLLFVWRGGRLLALAIGGFYLSLAPLSCVIRPLALLRFSEDVDFPVSERFLYIPSLYLALAGAWLIAYLIPRRLSHPMKTAVPAAILIGLTVVSAFAIHRRAIDWYDDFHLFKSGVRTSPFSVRMSNNYGFELMQDWQIKRARNQLLRCTKLVSEVHRERGAPMPVAFQNLGHSYYLQGEFDKAVEYYRQSFHYDPQNAVSANNLGALMGIFGSITMDINLIREGLEYYQRSVQLAPGYVYAKHSAEFMRKVFVTWQRYLIGGERNAFRVGSFGNSFLFAAKSISESEDPKFLQAMQILDSGLRHMPSDQEMVKRFGEPRVHVEAGPGTEKKKKEEEFRVDPHAIKRQMGEVFDRCFKAGVEKYEKLIEQKGIEDPDGGEMNPALNFLLAEVYRVGWRRSRLPEHLDRALAHYAITLASQPDHVGATRGQVELLRALGESARAVELATATVDALLQPEIPWEEPIPKPEPRRRTREAMELAKQIHGLAKMEIAVKGGKGAKDEIARWEAFLESTIQKCLEVQRARAQERLGGQDAESWNNLGYFCVRAFEVSHDAKLLEEAVKHLDYALELDPSRVGPALNKIHVLRLQGKQKEAERLQLLMWQRTRDPRLAPPSAVPGGAPGQVPPGVQPGGVFRPPAAPFRPRK
jgi:tetratricopeptide (TPR) repeat protein